MSVSLNKIVDVKVEVSSSVAITSDFDLGLIIGDTMMGTDPGTVKVYDAETFMSEMVNDGYSTEDPEYVAALSYFAQSPKPSRVMIGTAMADPDSGDPDYVASLEAFKNADDRFYAIAFAYERISESNLQRLDAFFEAVEASGSPKVCFFNVESQFTTQTTDVTTYFKDKGYTRLFVFDDSNGENIAIAFLGLISGLNSMQANSAYTAAYKTLSGVTAEDLTQAQLEFLVDNRANAYCKFGDRYSFTYPAVSCGGYHMDDLYFVDVAKFLIQQSVVGTLVSQRKIPQTESGMTGLEKSASLAVAFGKVIRLEASKMGTRFRTATTLKQVPSRRNLLQTEQQGSRRQSTSRCSRLAPLST